MRKAQLTDHASAQLEAIFDYTEHRWGTEQADRYVRAILQACEDAASGAISSRRIKAAYAVSGQVITEGRHFIYWRPRIDGDIDIVAILHNRMHQGMGLKVAFDGDPA